jgi:serine/threonine-protein kinase PRP4
MDPSHRDGRNSSYSDRRGGNGDWMRQENRGKRHGSDFRNDSSVRRRQDFSGEQRGDNRGHVNGSSTSGGGLIEEYQREAKRRKETESSFSSLISTRPAPPDSRDSFLDLSMPSTKIIDDVTYEKRVKEQMETIRRQKEEEENLDKIREQRRALLARTLTSSSSSSITYASHISNPSNHVHSSSIPSSVGEIGNEILERKPVVKTRASALKAVDSDDDMFAEDFVDDKADESQDGEGVEGGKVEGGKAVDDDEGYYSFRIGEKMGGGRYEVLGYYGKGVYSNVIRAKMLSKEGTEYAIKLLRNNAHMKRSGKKEVKVMKKLEESDAGGKCHCLKLVEHFEEEGHLCLVFDALDMNLTEVVKLYGHHVGLHIKAVRSYAFQLFKSLSLLKKCNIIHADIKPDNVLVSKDRNDVKLGDFGTAFESQEAELTNQLVSRYYRAPEIIIGLMPHSFPIDIFSIGCCLYEIATGSYLFPSMSDNHHLKLIMEICGPFPKKLLSSAHHPFISQHFSSNDDYMFMERFTDPLDSSKVLVRKLPMPSKPTRFIIDDLLSSNNDNGDNSSLSPTERAWVHRLADLITKCLILDPKKRITPEEALQHDFF